MASTQLGSIFTPSADTICPNNFSSCMENKEFLGFREIPNLLQIRKPSLDDNTSLYQTWRIS
jgi:hypothetical protein